MKMNKIAASALALALTAGTAWANVSQTTPVAPGVDDTMTLTVSTGSGTPLAIKVPRECVALFGQSLAEWTVAVMRPYQLALPARWPGEDALKCVLGEENPPTS